MNIQLTTTNTPDVRRDKLLAFVRAFAGDGAGRPDDEHPLPPGPHDPVIRIALERISVFGPSPEPWRSARRLAFLLGLIGARHPEGIDALKPHSFEAFDELNPQPLPPRRAFIASLGRTIVERAELMQDMSNAAGNEGEQRGIIIVGGYLAKIADDFCGTGFRLRWPFPNPPPPWFNQAFDGVDLVLLAAHLDQAAAQTFSPALKQGLSQASAKFAETGLSKIQ
jgi:hypothetical protein